MNKRGRPAGRHYRETIPVRLTPESIRAIERWMEQQPKRMSRSEAIRRLLQAALETSAGSKLVSLETAGAAARTIAGGSQLMELPCTDPVAYQAQLKRILADLQAKERKMNGHSRWSKELREPIGIPSSSILELLYGHLPLEHRTWYYAYEARIWKLAALRTQLGADSFWEVALWFAKRHVPGFKIACSHNSGSRIPWRRLRISLHAEVNALINNAVEMGEEKAGSPKAVERIITKLKKIGPVVYGRHSEATMRKQYYLAQAELKTKRG
jgi:Arc/MetJ-type ribon-helix-helix transcriptional regulator